MTVAGPAVAVAILENKTGNADRVEPLGNLINLSVLNLMENQITGDEK